MNTNILRETWTFQTSDHEAFKTQVQALDVCTKILFPDPYDIAFLGKGKRGDTKQEILSISSTSSMYFEEDPFTAIGKMKKWLPNEFLNQELVTESEITYPLFLGHEGENGKLQFFYTGAYVVPSLMHVLGIGDPNPVENFSFSRILDMASCFYRAAPRVTLVTREARIDGKKTRKIFSILSDSYAYHPLTGVTNLMEYVIQTHGGEVRDGYLDNYFARERVEFPTLVNKDLPGNLIPGIEISTSDTGRASFTICATYRYDMSNHVVYGETKRFSHRSVPSAVELKRTADEIFKNLTKVPKTLEYALRVQTQMITLDAVKEELQSSGLEMLLTKHRSKREAARIAADLKGKSLSRYDILRKLILLPEECEDLTPTLERKYTENVLDLLLK